MARIRDIMIDIKPTDKVVVYLWKGLVCLRMKSSLTRKRVLKSKAFEKTRKYAGNMAKAARLGSAIYKELNLAKKNRALYHAITGMAASLLYKGVDETEVYQILKKKYPGKRLQSLR